MSAKTPVIIVTGASKGLGLAITTLLLNKFNARVVALSRTKTPELLQLASDKLDIVPCDVTDESALTSAILNTEKNYKTIDGLILNAGVLDPVGLISSDIPVSAWKTHFDVNFFSLVTAVKVGLPALRKSELGGRIVFVSSGAAVGGTPSWGPYNAGKAALNSLCRTLAEEEPTVTSVAVRPGMVDTAMQAKVRGNEGNATPDAVLQKFLNAHAEGKLVKPEDAGHVIAALALRAPPDFSGKFLSWDSDDCAPFRSI